LGATFPIAIRWFAGDSANSARGTGWLYAVNTAGAAFGALAAGFVLIPWIGLSGTTRVGIAASAVAALSVFALTLFGHPSQAHATVAETAATVRRPKESRTRRSAKPETSMIESPLLPAWLAAVILGVSGFAALIHEIAWTRILSLVLGPTIYAFSATVA